MMMETNNNSVSLAGEFAVLSQLALRGYDANMTLGRTKSVDILVSDPVNLKMYKLEVKTNYQNSRNIFGYSFLFYLHFISAILNYFPLVFWLRCFVSTIKQNFE